MKAIREQLIKRLVKGEFLSGQALGEELGVSRAAISKHIAATPVISTLLHLAH